MKAKKLISAVTALILVCGMPVMSYQKPLIEMQAAEDFTEGTYENLFTYYKYSDHILVLSRVDKDNIVTLEIPSEIDDLPVTGISGKAFADCANLKSVTIPDTVMSMGGFYDCTSLTSITIPDSVTTIYNQTFSGCTSLTEIVIPNSVTDIQKTVFQNCTSLTSVKISENATTIGDSAFAGCTALTSVTIPESVTAVKDNAFSGCTNLTSLVIKNPKCELSATMTGYVLPFTIYGYANSTAQAYALSKGMEFKLLDDAPSDDNPTDTIEMQTGETKTITGYSGAEWFVNNADILSISQDGTIAAKSAGTAKVCAVTGNNIKYFTVNVTGKSLSIADLNGDGQVNDSDASDILRYYAHISTGGTLSFEEFMKK